MTIGRIGSLPGKEIFQFRVFDNAGRVIEESTAASTGEAGMKLSALHGLARRQALGADQALSDLLVSLEQIR